MSGNKTIKNIVAAGVVLALVAIFSFNLYPLNIHSTIFATPDGLSDNTVREIYQDSKGYLWFGTFNGLSRYDGYNIIKIEPEAGSNIPVDTQIRRIHEDDDGFLWIMGSSGIVSCFDLENEEFVDFLPQSDAPLHYLYIHIHPDGTIWLYGEDGVLRVEKTPQGLKSQRISYPDLGSNLVNRVAVDKEGKGFISTDKGVWVYNKGKITPFDTGRNYQWLLPTESGVVLISSKGDIVLADHHLRPKSLGKIEGVNSHIDLPAAFMSRGRWIVTSPNGGISIDNKTLEIRAIKTEHDISHSQVITDALGDIWLYNNTGTLLFYSKEDDRLIPLKLFPDMMLPLIDMERYAIARDKNSRAWIATGGNGLFLFDLNEKSLQHFSTEGGNYQILPSDRLLAAALDHEGNIWIGAQNGGAAMLNFETKGARVLDLPDSKFGYSGVRSIAKTPEGEVIVSSFDGNVYKYSPDLQSFEVIPREAVVYDVTVDSHGNIWEATRGKGVLLNGKKPHPGIPELSFSDVFAVKADNKDRIWVGTFGAGLDVLIPKADGSGYEKRNFLNGSYAERRIRSLYLDSKGKMWIATNNGVYRVDPDNFLSQKESPQLFNLENNLLRSNEVHAVIEDAQGRIWIGEAESGISILDFSQNREIPDVTHIGTENGLSHDNVQSFVMDKEGNMWVTTLYGVSKINPETMAVDSYVFMPTPGENIHNSNSAILLDDGNLLFGTNQGAYIVKTAQLSVASEGGPITVTSFKVDGEQIPFTPGKKSGKDYIEKKDGKLSIKLPYDKNSLEFSFSTFDFDRPKQTSFRYRLEPVDADWMDMGEVNILSFKNLAPGKYTLQVEATNNSGRWDQNFSCEIIIRSPWWTTWWARLVYLFLILGGMYLIIRIVERMNNLRSQIKLEEQLTDYKLEFFTNISHEFRTPLTLIQVSLEKLHDKLVNLKQSNPGISLSSLSLPLSTLDKNVSRMSRLIDELLTFRKVEKGKMILRPEPTDIIGFLKEIYENFKDEALSKGIEYSFESNRESFEMNVDRNAFEKIATNLISNALKYTREKGKVSIHADVNPEAKLFTLRVADNGIGIPEEKKEQLFSRFMHSAMSRNSIGVGLHLTFGLVQLHQGKINHSDNAGGGSIFTVTLPTDMPPSENLPEEGIGRPSFDTIFKDESNSEEAEATSPVENTKNMLIIDDDAEIRNFLSKEFSRYFMILLASDGQSGLEAARNNDVHIIICDVMMPDMSGYEVTRLLKEDFATSHIPIIQLTALSNDDCQLEGITSGADAYITKPFNLKYLMTRVAKLIEQRENLFAKYSANPTMARPELPMGDKDKEFTDRLSAIAEKHLDNSEFSVDDFASEMAMGRTIFFRKVKGVTGYSPKEYLRVMRMKKAAELLLTTDLTITEITYKVGISDPAYFNKCFKAQFGKAPSVYQKENTAQGKETS